ncbi:hypothetical protein RM52_04020 [Microbacterium hominis]|uniref:D-inositol 3-phosphate glycosyltransferase n=2 Tax=Microbacterium hominis TaxID=162426 RepID=A0A0B4DYN8_9MICO|nr:hypothetical protein RM52_04020 [Microbacterium hominis]
MIGEPELHRGYTIRSMHTLCVGRGERLFYFLLGGLQRRVFLDAVLIGGWDSPAYWQVLAMAKLRRVRSVGFYESTLASQHHTSGPVAMIRRAFFRSLDAVVVPGQAAHDALRQMGVSDSRIYVGFNAVDVDSFRRPRDWDEPSGDGHHFIYVGQLIPRKNVDSLLDAFLQIRRPGDTLTFIGSGDLAASLRQKAETVAPDGSVRFAPAVHNASVPELLWRSHTLVLPSLEEVWGLVVNEALAAGLHVVVAEGAGVASSVRTHRGVFVCDPSCVSVADAMSQSRAGWEGPIQDPEILRYTPERFAEVFIEAMALDPVRG